MATTQKKVALGMSGGVDSSLSAHLLLEQGYQVTGVYMECWRAPGCRTEEDRKDALQVALELDIPFQVLDFKEVYKQKVVEYFFKEYEAGHTPNPDVMCNKEVKFGIFYDWAMENGFDFVATGHYAKIVDENNSKKLAIPADTHKDQTYFLYLLRSEQLEHILFPLSQLTKPEVRKLAQEKGISVAAKKDSVGICFIGNINVHNFLEERLGKNPGEVIDTAGIVIGQHEGLWFYTVGQRHGFEIDKRTLIHESDGTDTLKHNFPPFYVIKKIPEKNQLVVGFGAETYQDTLRVENLHWITPAPRNGGELLVRIRHTGELLQTKLEYSLLSNTGTATLRQPLQGVAEGQSAVFYATGATTNIICLGGGVMY